MNDLIERLESFCIPEPNSGCWLWLGAVSTGTLPYGCMRLNGRTTRAHRASYEAHNGFIPHGMSVCHRCDNSLCINPEHLFLGTRGDNNVDRSAKGRDSWQTDPSAAKNLAYARTRVKTYHVGESANLAKLTETSVREIRDLAKRGLRQRAIAAKFSISQSVVSWIVSGKGWRHVN